MADKHPYTSSSGALVKTVNHLRKTFPQTVTADTLKKLGFAPRNESYIINILRFLGLIDEEGKKTDIAGKIFSSHQEGAFQQGFGDLVKKSYSELFSLHKEEAWSLDMDKLVTFFRQSDQTSAIVGGRQAKTFTTMRGLAGHGEILEPRKPSNKEIPQKGKHAKEKPKKPPVEGSKSTAATISQHGLSERPDFGLTVRVEINLPTEGDQATYDRIFKSIRENLLNG